MKIDQEINFQSWILFFIDFSPMLQLCQIAVVDPSKQEIPAWKTAEGVFEGGVIIRCQIAVQFESEGGSK